MKTFLDIITDVDFRNYAMKRLAACAKDPYYSFPHKFPPLFRYSPLRSYSVKDIVSEQATITSIGEFNDLFDGAIHQYGTIDERKAAAEKEWHELEKLRTAAKLSGDIIPHDYYTSLWTNYFRDDSLRKFSLLANLGVYVCCFSTVLDSTLMWSHYADSNRGICVEYDFNQWDMEDQRRNWLFPIAYSNNPADVSALIDEKRGEECEYPVDTALLCAALNKASIWEYEKEWRLLLLFPGLESVQRLPLRIALKPSAIHFGHHFLKPCFYYDFHNYDERQKCKNNIATRTDLLDYMMRNNIPAFIMMPTIGDYKQKPMSLHPKTLQSFIENHFEKSTPEDIRYYTVIHHKLMNCIEEQNELL